MRVKVRRVGNSITVTTPKEIVVDLGIDPNMEVDVSVRDGSIVLERVEDRWESLLAEVRVQAAKRGLTEADVDRAIFESRAEST